MACHLSLRAGVLCSLRLQDAWQYLAGEGHRYEVRLQYLPKRQAQRWLRIAGVQQDTWSGAGAEIREQFAGSQSATPKNAIGSNWSLAEATPTGTAAAAKRLADIDRKSTWRPKTSSARTSEVLDIVGTKLTAMKRQHSYLKRLTQTEAAAGPGR
jgi:hypothetical protein